MKGNTALDQYMTPTWAAEALVESFFPELSPTSRVVEPSCGDGRFLLALPHQVPGIGVEIDPQLADRARSNTGRRIIEGDFLSADVGQPTHIIGNPPFNAELVDAFLNRAHQLMDDGGTVGFVLPVFLFQTASRMVGYNRRWSLRQNLIPRNIFEQMQKPLLFATFVKETNRSIHGFFLYHETHAVRQLKRQYRLMFLGNASRASLWGEVVEQALVNLGGEASLEAIYAEIEGKRPYEGNAFWKAQIRKVLRQVAVRTGDKRWALIRNQPGLFDTAAA